MSLVKPRALSVFATDPSKAFYERFSLIWAPLSMFVLLAGLIGTGLYSRCGRDEYLAVSLLICLPGFVYPVLFPDPCDVGRLYIDRFWVKASAWIAIFSFYGNYFWTHYFYTILGAEYLFDSYMLNNVPVVTYLCTFFYFTFYFAFINVVLRLVKRKILSVVGGETLSGTIFGSFLWCSAIVVAAVSTAVFEAVTIQHFPLYTYRDRSAFLTVGSVFYGIYFMVGFPMFFALDEDINDERPLREKFSRNEKGGTATQNSNVRSVRRRNNDNYSDSTVPGGQKLVERNHDAHSFWYFVQNSLAAVAVVTLGLDLWRLCLGDIYSLVKGQDGILHSAYNEVPFITQRQHSVYGLT
jgi:cycloeucalenol cycloisomerase